MAPSTSERRVIVVIEFPLGPPSRMRGTGRGHLTGVPDYKKAPRLRKPPALLYQNCPRYALLELAITRYLARLHDPTCHRLKAPPRPSIIVRI